jgi:3-methyladenine DNA glycosylase AlkC
MENPNAFKNLISENVVKKIASGISNTHPKFSQRKFLKLLQELPALELKARVLLITRYLKQELPEEYSVSLKILIKTMEAEDMRGFELWPFSEYISQFGLNHFDESMLAMYRMTERFSAEFAIRPFILKNHIAVLKYFTKWSKDKNHHIRRWISEGSRPLLPWGQRIPLFVMDPTHTLHLLDKLRFDDELYVRKSIANHLNDISKNHPQVVIDILKMWQDDVPEIHVDKIKWITRHALRTLIKKGHPGALKIMGVEGRPNIELQNFKLNKKRFSLNDKLNFSFDIQSKSKKTQTLIIDYSIDFVKANGKKGKKVFKLKTVQLDPGEKLNIEKNHHLKPITTMKFYSGIHHLKLQINGEVLKESNFLFSLK